MSRWFQLEIPGESFFDEATHRYDYRIDVPVPAQALWDSLVSDESMAAWGPSVKSVQWLTARPFGVGTRRAVTLAAGSVTVHEQFTVWDEGRRFAFHVFESNRPGLLRFAEDYRISSTPTGSRLDWTVALDPAPLAALPMRLASPLTRAAFGRLAADGRRYFARAASSDS